MGGLAIPMTVIVIFLVVWIISNVIRAQQDANQAAARRNNAGNRQAAAPRGETRGNSDIDRFLQEIDRLRKKGQQDKVQQQDEQAAPPPKPKPVGERRSDTGRGRSSGAPKPPREPRPASPPRSTREPAPIVAELVTPPVTTSKPGSLASTIDAKAETARVAAAAAVRAAPGAKGRTAAVARPRSTSTADAPLPATLQMIQKLFHSKQGAAAAVLLHEIFGPPRALRG